VVKALADAGDSLVGALRGLITFPFSDGLVDDSVAKVEAACPSNTVETARNGYCPGDYLNLDINISVNPQQGAGLIAALLSMGGVTLPSTPLAAPTSTSTATKSDTTATSTDDDESSDEATPTATATPSDSEDQAAEPEQKKGLLCGLLSLCRTPALSVAEARQTDLGRLLVEPVVSE